MAREINNQKVENESGNEVSTESNRSGDRLREEVFSSERDVESSTSLSGRAGDRFGNSAGGDSDRGEKHGIWTTYGPDGERTSDCSGPYPRPGKGGGDLAGFPNLEIEHKRDERKQPFGDRVSPFGDKMGDRVPPFGDKMPAGDRVPPFSDRMPKIEDHLPSNRMPKIEDHLPSDRMPTIEDQHPTDRLPKPEEHLPGDRLRKQINEGRS